MKCSKWMKSLLATACGALLITGCGSDDTATTSTKSADKGEITVYTALEDDELKVYMEAFKKAHPSIEVNLVRDSTGIVTAKLLAEKENPQADVVWGLAATSLLVCDRHDMLAGYKPAYFDQIRGDFKDTKNSEPRWVGIKAWMTGLVCNTIEMKNRNLPYPKSYDDLLDQRFANQLIMPHPASSGTGFLTVSAILQLMGEEKGWDYLDKLHGNMLRYTHSGSKPAKLAGKGECSVGISFGYRGTKQKQKGEPVKTMFPKEGCGWDMEANALMKKENIKPAARTFLDWAISPEAMTMYSQVYPIVANGMKVEVPDEDYPANPSQQLIKNDLDWAAANRDRILKEWSRRYESKADPKS